MDCSTNKKAFDSKKDAHERAKEINAENREKGDNTKLRAYHCRECLKYHLSSMSKNDFNKIDPIKKAMKRTKRNVMLEAEYWSNKLGVEYGD